MRYKRNNKKARKGDFVYFRGQSFEIAKILFSDWCGTWNIEFIDTEGHFQHWNEYYDEGRLTQISATDKRRVNRFGDDCTDLFLKYGQPL